MAGHKAQESAKANLEVQKLKAENRKPKKKTKKGLNKEHQ